MNSESTPNSSEAGSDTTGSSRSSCALPDSLEARSPTRSEETANSGCTTSASSASCATASPSWQPASLDQLQIELSHDGKVCVDCRRKLPVECYSLHRGGTGDLFRNRRCNQCRARRQAGSPYVQSKRQLVADAKSVPCCDCGKNYPTEGMEFDHVRGKKEFNIGSAVHWAPIGRLKDEMAKCDVVCAVCHRVRTSKLKHQRPGRPPKYGGALYNRSRKADVLAEVRRAREKEELSPGSAADV